MTKGDLVISADFGTSGVKVGLVYSSLSVLARVTESYPLVLKTGGIAEQSPDDWWGALAHALATLRQEVPDLSKRAAALVFSSQLCGLVCCDANGTPLRPCLTWLDKRADPLGKKINGGFPDADSDTPPSLLPRLRLANGPPPNQPTTVHLRHLLNTGRRRSISITTGSDLQSGPSECP